MPFDPLAGHGCHFLRALLRNNEASLPLVESRTRERVMDTGSLITETRSEASLLRGNNDRSGNPVLQNKRTASQPLCAPATAPRGCYFLVFFFVEFFELPVF
jgi:hypothetical protein